MNERVWLSLGSNIERERNLSTAIAALRERFGELTLSRVYESAAVGFDGENFFNLVAGFWSSEPVSDLQAALRAIEHACGRRRDGGRFAPRTLDIDLLTYGERVLESDGVRLPRDEIIRYAFVLCPLAEVAGDERHPVSGDRYRELWERFDSASQPLWPVELTLD